MVIITFPDKAAENRGLGYLMTHFSGRALRGGIYVVPEAALAALAREGFSFSVKGKATYEQQAAPVPDSASSTVPRRRRRSAGLVRRSG